MQRGPVLFVAIIVSMISLTAGYQFSSPVGSATPISSASANSIPAGLREARSCPQSGFIVSLRNEQGFLTARKLTNESSGEPGLFDFVLRPGSTGHLNLTYQVYEPAHDTHNTTEGVIRDLFSSQNNTAWEMFNWPYYTKHVGVVNGTVRFIVIPDEKVGLSVNASTITPTSPYSVDVTYTIRASASAERGTYRILLPGMCLGQLVTIGDTPYQGP